MNDPGGVRVRAHPRRPPAHQSVSLRHSPPASRPLPKGPTTYTGKTSLSSPNGPASDKANPPSSVSAPIDNKHSSGESSDAGKWYESTNNNAVQSNVFADNDPPFHLQNSSSSDTPPDARDPRSIPLYHPSGMTTNPSGLLHTNTDGSSTEDFRSVIDDLTVANKRLKQKLKRYEKLYDAHLQDEKLFEVRFHKLPDHKKRELEETLRKFAADLDDSMAVEQPPAVYAAKPDLSTGTSRFAESGYVSMSASGRNSSSVAAPSSAQDSHNKPASKSAYNRNQRNVQSYLHDIPAGLLPKQPTPMTDKSKKKLIVRRLEQLFAGKVSAPGTHPQPMQQEEVAQSAAQADRQAKEASGQQSRKEGLREARIMPVRSEDEDIVGTGVPPKLRPYSHINEPDFAAPGYASPDQRPTRPLDLDLERAQVPAQNMDYIRHLGFTPPDMYIGTSPDDGHGWIYLNLLINMAQLHTMNVTPDFVKDAVSDYSSKFELSHDGRKIRWKGGSNLTRNSSEGGSSEHLTEQSSNDVDGCGSSPVKRLKTVHSGTTESTDPDRKARRTARALKEQQQKKYSYTPIFFHKDDSDDEEDFYGPEESSSNSQLLHPTGDSSGFTSSNMKSSSSQKRREGGPMIFYNKAKFCTDLSGDRRGCSVMDPTLYKSVAANPVGASSESRSYAKEFLDFRESRGALDTQSMEIDEKEFERNASSGEEMDFSPASLQNDSGDNLEPMEFEASGLGGVQPGDNFAIKVKRELTCSTDTSALKRSSVSRRYPPKILEALRNRYLSEGSSKSAKPAVCSEIVSTTQKDLPSSMLPPASFLPFDSTSSADVDDSDLESDVSSSASTTSSSDKGPGTALRLLNISPADNSDKQDSSEEEDEEEDSDSDESDDGSMDILATARALDPETVRASEREYDSTLADRLAEDIPAGSSAATAGGGSGFNSPASGILAESLDEKMKQGSASASASRGSLKRTRTSDSLAFRDAKGKAKARRSDSSYER